MIDMKEFKEMEETEKQAHLVERLEKMWDNYVQEYDISRISFLGAMAAFMLKTVESWKTDDMFDGGEDVDEDDE